MEGKKVVITGLGALTPIGNNVADYWQGLKDGQSGADLIKSFDATNFRCKFACELKGFDPLEHFDRKAARKMDPFTQYAMVAADEAIEDSGIKSGNIPLEKIGVIWGSGVGGLLTFQNQVLDYGDNGRDNSNYKFNPFFIPKMIIDIAPGHISIKHGFRGPNFSVVSACASSTNAILDAYYYIKLGKADAIVAGGSEAAVTISGVGGFGDMRALSTRNDDPKTASRPFDLDREGFVLGEGAGAIIVESEESALKRGAKIYAEILGGGLSADAHHLTAPHPDGLGANLVMQNALNEAGIQPEEVDYINVHGTSTPLGDVSEVKAISQVFGDHTYKLNISSTKSMTGHLLGAAGAIETISCIMAIQQSVIPPTINHFTDDPEFDPNINFTFNKAQEKSVDIALSNTFGFGGHNASVIIKKY